MTEKQIKKPRKRHAPVYIESLDEAKYNLPRDQIKFDPFAFRS